MHKPFFKPSMNQNPLKAPLRSFSKIANYQIIKTIGRVSSCKIKLAKNLLTDQECAIKIVKSEFAASGSLNLREEATIHSLAAQKRHNSILQFTEFLSSADYVRKDGSIVKVDALVMEFAEEGNLFEYLQSSGPLSEDDARICFNQIINGIEYLQENGIAHMFLTLENLLLTKDLSVKIGNFSAAKLMFSKTDSQNEAKISSSSEDCKTESNNNDKNATGFQKDLFACGVILFTLIAGHLPFQREHPQDLHYNLIMRQKYSIFWAQHEKRGLVFSSQFKNLINGMIAHEPSERMTISEIKCHPWLSAVGGSSGKAMVRRSQRGRNLLGNNSEVLMRKENMINMKINENMSKGTNSAKPRLFYAMKGIQAKEN